ncbi:unnamed protein product [Blepharisma stoltei]|uniref:Tetratricopeptide repeat protein n=1 Tax=Blepharisma stoltei TaxID=1481888 RepID=A0AAU9JF73_9CILI|nr:unnamed protein product [Blepharisma stoltei]
MNSVCCSLCSLDAIFISVCSEFVCPKHIFISDCGKILCPKHKSKGDELKRIKIPINEESKAMLWNFLYTLKKKIEARFDELIINQNNEKDKEELRLMHKALHDCNLFMMNLLKKKFVEAKLILSPFDYFLTQPKEKTQQYIEKLRDRNDLLRLYRSAKTHLFDFNYFKFEDKKFIHGWAYKSSYNLHDHLLDFCIIVFLDFIKIEEYEMAYELYENLKSYLEFYQNSSDTIRDILALFGEILKQKIMQKKDYPQLEEQYLQLEEQWKQILIKKITDNLSKKFVDNQYENINPLDFLVYLYPDIVLHLISKDSNIFDYYSRISDTAKFFSQFYSENTEKIIKQKLGLEKERQQKDSLDINELACFLALKNDKWVKRGLKLAESKIVKPFGRLFSKFFGKKSKKKDYSQLEESKQLLILNPADNLSKKSDDINPIDLLKYLFSNMTPIDPIDCLVYLFCDIVLHMMSKDCNISECYSRISHIAECFSQFDSKYIGNRIHQELGLIYYGNKNYGEAIEHFMKSIDYHKERLGKDWSDNKELVWDESLKYLIEAYRWKAKAHSALKQNKEIREILKLVESKCSETKDKLLYDATIGEIYYYLYDFDKAYKIIWKCIKICKQKKFINSYELSNLRFLLADIYVWRGDFKKAHESLCEAKSFYSILPIADPNEQEIYKTFGVFYLNRQCYDDALINFGKIANRWPSHELLFAKFSMGIAYFWKLDYQNARDFLNEAKSMMSSYTESNKNELFIANAYLGALCYLQGNLEDADNYFFEAFKLIDYYDFLNIDMFLKSQRFVFSYFYTKSDYEKCETILLRFNEILENYNHLKFRMPLYFIQLAELFIAWNKKEQAKECLIKAERLLNIDKIVLFSKASIKINDLDCISDYIDIAKIYIYLFNISDESLRKAEKILKYAEEVVSEKRRNDQFSKLDVYILLGDLYFKTQRYKKSKRYFSKALDFQKKLTIT